MKLYRIVYRTKNGGYRNGSKKYMNHSDAVHAFAKNPRAKHIAVLGV